jgi:hypothetical protein
MPQNQAAHTQRSLYIPFKYPYPKGVYPKWVRSNGVVVCLEVIRVEDQIYSHQSNSGLDKGLWRHFHIATMVEMVKRHPDQFTLLEVLLVADDATFILNNAGVERGYLSKLTADQLNQPGLMCLLPDGSSILVDGNHRYVRRFFDRCETMGFWQFTEAQARYALLDIPDSVSPAFIT